MSKYQRQGLRQLLFWLFSLSCIAGLALFFMVVFYYFQLPDPNSLATRRVNESTKIYDASGTVVLYDVHGEEKRTVIPWEEIPDVIKHATLAAEDNDFYNHSGIDVRGIIRALYKDVTTLSTSQGGSTITQQLVKKSIVGEDKTLARKIKEALLSIQIEGKFSKDEIFWMYLNQIPYGSNAYGIEAASQTYFGKSSKNLTLSEAAFLSGLPQSPSYYRTHLDKAFERRDFILGRMLQLQLITQSEYDQAVADKLVIRPKQEKIEAPHFVIMVKDYLIKKYGADIVENGGLNVVTTLNPDYQKIAEDVVTKFGTINEKRYKAKNAAFVAANPKTGAIQAMVGSRDYFDVEHEGNFNVALAHRQPGSSFKPFAYAEAFDKGFTDSTILFDLPTEFNPECDSSAQQKTDRYGQKCYNPQNYSGTYAGPVTARQALDQSLNLPAVQMLYLAGIEDTTTLARNMGINDLKSGSQYGLSLVLGGAEVRLLDMVTAYGVFANDGIRAEPYFIEKITTNSGSTLEEHTSKEKRVLSEQVTRLMSDVLSDNNARGPVFGYNSSLFLSDRPVAAKTGTTQDNRDGWLIGYTPSLVAGVWTGNNDNSSMTQEGAGLSAAGPMWHEFMVRALAKSPRESFPKPDPITTEKIMLNGNYNGPSGIHSILYYVSPKDPNGDIPDNPGRDSQFANWEAAVQRWLQSTGQINPSPSISPLVSN